VFRQGLVVLRSLAVAADVGKIRSFESHYASVRDDFLLLMAGAMRLFSQQALSIPERESMYASAVITLVKLLPINQSIRTHLHCVSKNWLMLDIYGCKPT